MSLRARQHGDRQHGERQRRGDAGGGAEHAADGVVEHRRPRPCPASAGGSFSANEPNPSSCVLSTCSQRSSGGLSTARLPPGLVGAEQEIVQRQRHAAHGGVVEGIARHRRRATKGAAPPRAREQDRAQIAACSARRARPRVRCRCRGHGRRNDRTAAGGRVAPARDRLGSRCDERASRRAPPSREPCSACRGTGTVDLEPRRRAARAALPVVRRRRACSCAATTRRRAGGAASGDAPKRAGLRAGDPPERDRCNRLKVSEGPSRYAGKEGQHRRVTVVVCGAGAGT